MIRHLDIGMIMSRATRLGRVADSDAVFPALIAFADAQGGSAPMHMDLAFSGIGSTALPAIASTGLRAGVALGKPPGPNADFIWFSRGRPFYADCITLVIPVSQLSAIGGFDSAGLAGQSNVMKVPHKAAPGGIPLTQFAIVYAVARGFVIPIYKPSHWIGPAGEEMEKLPR
jgi:hypothetical protein